MPTSVHFPKLLLAELDRRARHLRVSRNRLIVRAVERDLAMRTHWSPGFFDRLAAQGPGSADAVDEMLRVIASRRTRKPPPVL